MNVSRSQLKAKDNTEHTNPTSYSWSILRLALIKISTHKIQELVKVAGIELQGSCSIPSVDHLIPSLSTASIFSPNPVQICR